MYYREKRRTGKRTRKILFMTDKLMKEKERDREKVSEIFRDRIER